jgi:cytochrome c553
MLKLLVGVALAAALAMLGHAALIHLANGASGAAPAARSTCASCHG